MTDRPIFRDPDHPIADRVVDLRSRMTLDEKVAQVGSVRARDLVTADGFDPEAAAVHLDEGIGHVSRAGGWTGFGPDMAAEAMEDIQRYLREQTRLGIPATDHEECLCGYMGRGGTTFPQAIGLASTWNPGLVEDVATAIGRQVRAVGATQALSPVLDLGQDPRWGRLEETFGEDPYLVGALGAAYVRGVQSTGVDATLKHFAGHGTPEGGRDRTTVHAGPRRLRSEVLFPFEVAIREADARSVMTAYNDIDGIPCTASRSLLTDVLRDEWGFDGPVVSDYRAIEFLRAQHRVASDDAEAAGQAMHAGVDVELPSTVAFDELQTALERGIITESELDRAVDRVLASKVRSGLFDDAVTPDVSVSRAFDTDAVRDLARTAARESIVMLENDGVLPLEATHGSVAVIGPKADFPRGQLGDYAYRSLFHASDGTDDIVTPLDAIRSEVDTSVDVSHTSGCAITGNDRGGIEDAVEAAADASVALVFVGGFSGRPHPPVPLGDPADDPGAADAPGGPDGLAQTSGEKADRCDIGLPGVQSELVQAVVRTDTPTVVVVVSGRPHPLSWAKRHAAAIVHAWLPGEQGGAAIADVLFGRSGPTGRMPVTVPRSSAQLPAHYRRHPNAIDHAFVDEADPILWPFGFGRTYTRMAYMDLQVSTADVPTIGSVEVDVDVENVGEVAGVEVVQLYARRRTAPVACPERELLGFQRIELAPGHRATVRFTIDAEQLGIVDRTGKYVVVPGETELMAGSDATDAAVAASVDLTGDRRPVDRREAYLTPTAVERDR